MQEKLTLFESFSGAGMQRRGLDNFSNFEIESIGTSDIEPDAILAYAAIHCGLTQKMLNTYEYPSQEEMAQYLTDRNIGYDFKKKQCKDWFKCKKGKGLKDLQKYYLASVLQNNVGDISKAKELPYSDILTFSFPCQSISVAGKQEGIVEGETRSGLIYEIVRLLKVSQRNNTLPKYLLLENVAALVSKKFIKDFENLNQFFDELGYSVYWKLLNAKECGIPQNRLRTFAIYIRKDIDNHTFTFPKPFDNGIRLKDVLEENVDEKYYISNDKVEKFLSTLPVVEPDGTIGDETACQRIGNIYNNEFTGGNYAGNVYKTEGVSPALNTCEGGGRQPHILDTPDTSYCIDANYWKGTTPEQYVEKHRRQLVTEKNVKIRIRKLTPDETWILMGLTKSDCEKARSLGISNSSLYKIAGNGICCPCIELIAEHLYKAQYDESYECFDENFRKPSVE